MHKSLKSLRRRRQQLGVTIKASTDDEDERAGCPRGQLDASPVPAEDSSVFHFGSNSKKAIKRTRFPCGSAL